MNIRYLILILTTRCNLACAYCYNGTQAETDMSPVIIDKSLFLAACGQGPLHIQITGGEPTLVFELVTHTVEKAKSLGRAVTLGIQTNGTRLTPAVVSFLNAHNFQVGLSLDGPVEINDSLRGDTAELLRGIRMLEEAGQDFTVTTVVSKTNVGYLHKLPLILGGYGRARGFGLDLVISKGGGLLLGPEPKELIAELNKVKETLAAVNKYRIRPLVWREMELVTHAASRHGREFCHGCLGESLAVGPDGRAYPCGQTHGSAEFALGLVDDLVDLKSPLTRLRLSGEYCRDCPLMGRCPGECPSRLHFNSGAQSRLACDMYLAIAGALD